MTSEAAMSVQEAFENPDTQAAVAESFASSIAANLDGVDQPDVTITHIDAYSSEARARALQTMSLARVLDGLATGRRLSDASGGLSVEYTIAYDPATTDA